MPFPVLLSTLIRSWFQAQPATLLITIDPPFLFAVEELYSTRYQSGSFSLINVGSGFHCLLVFSFLFSYMNLQLVHNFLSQQNTRPFLFLAELMESFWAGRDQSAADQPNNLTEGYPHCNHCNNIYYTFLHTQPCNRTF